MITSVKSSHVRGNMLFDGMRECCRNGDETDIFDTVQRYIYSCVHILMCVCMYMCMYMCMHVCTYIPGTCKFLSPIEDIIRLRKRITSTSLLIRWTKIPDLTKSSIWHYQASIVSAACNEDDTTAEQRRIKMKIKSDKRKLEADAVKRICQIIL